MPDSYDDFIQSYYGSPSQDLNSPVPQSAYGQPYDVDALIAESQGIQPEIQMPAEDVARNSLPEEVVSQSRGQSVAVSESGFNPALYESQKGLRSGTDRRSAARGNEYSRQAEEESAAVHDLGERQKGLVAEQTDLDRRIADEKLAIQGDATNLARDAREAEGEAQIKAEQDADLALAEYQQARKEFGAMQVNPGKLWGDMSGGERFGTLVSVFAHNMLATKGINTTVMDSLDKAIDRNIDAQLQNIQKKGQEVGMFKQAWDMIRSQSESEAEARGKMRGLLLEEFKQGAVGRLMSFDSELARVQGQRAAMDIDARILDNDLNLRKQLREDKFQILGQEMQRTDMEMQRALQSRSVRVQEMEAQARKQAAEQVDPAALGKEVDKKMVIDTTPGGDKSAWILLDPEKATVNRDKMAQSAALMGDLLEYQRLAKENSDTYGSFGAAYLNSPQALQMKALRTKIVNNYVNKVAATTFTDGFLKRIETMIPEDTILKPDAVNRTVGQLAQAARGEQEQFLVNNARKANQEEYDYIQSVRLPNPVTTNVGPHADDPAEGSYAAATGTAANLLAADKGKDVTPTTRKIGSAENDAYNTKDNRYAVSRGSDTDIKEFVEAGFEPELVRPMKGGKMAKIGIPNWFNDYQDIADTITDISRTDGERQEALDFFNKKLQDLGESSAIGSFFDNDEAQAAAYFMTKLQNQGRLDSSGNLVLTDRK